MVIGLAAFAPGLAPLGLDFVVGLPGTGLTAFVAGTREGLEARAGFLAVGRAGGVLVLALGVSLRAGAALFLEVTLDLDFDGRLVLEDMRRMRW